MANPNFSKAYTADVDIAPYLILKAGSGDGFATLATAATDKLMGVSENVQVAATQIVDAVQEGVTLVAAGGTIAAGDFLTADSTSRAITATPGSGLTVNTIGKAQVSAVVGDVFPMIVSFGQLRG